MSKYFLKIFAGIALFDCSTHTIGYLLTKMDEKYKKERSDRKIEWDKIYYTEWPQSFLDLNDFKDTKNPSSEWLQVNGIKTPDHYHIFTKKDNKFIGISDHFMFDSTIKFFKVCPICKF